MFKMNWKRFDEYVCFPFGKTPSKASDKDPVVLVLCLEQEMKGLVISTFIPISHTLDSTASFKTASTINVANELMDRHPNITGIIIADAAIAANKNSVVSKRVVKYARAGGTIIVGGFFGQFIAPAAFNQYFEKT